MSRPKLGSLQPCWSKGHRNSPFLLISPNEGCYATDNCIVFSNLNEKSTRYLHPGTEGISSLTVNPLYPYISFSETSLKAKIFIYEVDDDGFHRMSTLSDGTVTGYDTISFAPNSTLLASFTSGLDSKLILWQWQEEMILTSITVLHSCLSVTFNPFDWHHFCGISNGNLIVWSIDQFDTKYFINASEFKSLSSNKSVGSEKVCPLSFDISIYTWLNSGSICISTKSGDLAILNPTTNDIKILNNMDNIYSAKQNNIDVMVLSDGLLYMSGKDGIIVTLELTGLKYKIFEKKELPSPATFGHTLPLPGCPIAFSLNEGQVYSAVKTETSTEVQPILKDSFSTAIGVDFLCHGEQYLVVCKDNGSLQILDVENGETIGNTLLPIKATAVVCSPSQTAVFVASDCGSIFVINLCEPSQPKVIQIHRLYQSPITCLCVDNSGMFLLAGSNDGKVYLMEASVSSNCKVIGYTEIDGYIHSLDCFCSCDTGNKLGIWSCVIAMSENNVPRQSNHLYALQWKANIVKCDESIYVNDLKLLCDDAVKKRRLLSRVQIDCLKLISHDTILALCSNTKNLITLPIPNSNEASYVIEPIQSYTCHILGNGHLSATTHRGLIASSSSDGYVLLRSIKHLEDPAISHCHDYHFKGTSHLCIGGNSNKVATISGDGRSVSCWKWIFPSAAKSIQTRAIEVYRNMISSVKQKRIQEDEIMNNSDSIDIDTISKNILSKATWFEEISLASHNKEDERLSSMKINLRKEIESVRQTVLDAMKANNTVSDLEKLPRSDFEMDIEKRKEFMKQQQELLKDICDETDLENTSKQYIHNAIISQCWNGMNVKGRCLRGFHSNVEVSNYPLKDRTPTELMAVEQAETDHKIENAGDMIGKKVLGEIRDSLIKTASDDDDIASSREDNREMKQNKEDQCNGSSDVSSHSLYGSHGCCYGGKNDSLLSQLGIHSSVQKKNQMVLLEDCVHRIKVAFNKQFDDIYHSKENEIKRIDEKNARIQKILLDLNIDEPLFKVKWTNNEHPEDLLTVFDHEIKAEQCLSEEQQKQLEDDQEISQERLKAEKADNVRERALDLMMAGQLEISKEDELKKDLVEPDFMEKIPGEWTEEEAKQAKEFEKKQQQLVEDRLKFKKALETELRKIQTAITETTSAFDERLLKLFKVKVKTEMVIAQEELKILRLAASIEDDKEFERLETECLIHLESQKTAKQQSQVMLKEAKIELEQFKDKYEFLVIEDKQLDKAFRREFADLDILSIENLYKLFKKRPRGQRTLKAAAESQAIGENTGSSNRSARPSSSHANATAAALFDHAMQELDDESNAPDGLDMEIWKRFVNVRMTKVNKEQQVKSSALTLAEMTAVVQRRTDFDDHLRHSVDSCYKELQKIRDDKFKNGLNLEIQILLKQGQVEIPDSQLTSDVSDCLLIHRSVIEDLNATIKTLGESKLASMTEIKDFRKGIHQLEWEHKKMMMQAQDLKTAARDIQMLRVTKELQSCLGEGDQHSRQQKEIASLEKTLAMHSKMHRRNMTDKKRTLFKLEKEIKKKENENDQLDEDLQELSLSVAERRNVDDENKSGYNTMEAQERMQEIISRKKMVDLAKLQSTEIAVLRAEVERLRMRTFPALAQLDQH